MSSALAMASVTAVLKNLLHNELIRPSSNTYMGDITITALSPDRIPLGAEERAQLNLYLYRLTPNSGWQRTKKLSSHVGLGQAQGTVPTLGGGQAQSTIPMFGGGQAQGTVPTLGGGQAQDTIPTLGGGRTQGIIPAASALALDLHYLITAYGEQDFQAEMLLGHAIQILHETPVLTSEAIRSVLTSTQIGGNRGTTPSPFSTSSLIDQAEEIKISPEFLSMEEMSKLWSTLQAHSRLSVTYQVSVVLIKDRRGDPMSDT